MKITLHYNRRGLSKSTPNTVRAPDPTPPDSPATSTRQQSRAYASPTRKPQRCLGPCAIASIAQSSLAYTAWWPRLRSAPLPRPARARSNGHTACHVADDDDLATDDDLHDESCSSVRHCCRCQSQRWKSAVRCTFSAPHISPARLSRGTFRCSHVLTRHGWRRARPEAAWMGRHGIQPLQCQRNE